MPLHDGPVLGFDTSGGYCTVAIVHGSAVLAHRHEVLARGQGERLFPLLEETLADAGIDWSALSAIGVGTGPGNFTGIRISVSAARGLALSLGKPAIGVSGLAALAHDVPRPCIATVAARRDGTYVQVFENVQDHAPAMMAKDDLLKAVFPTGARCLGDAAEMIAAECGGLVTPPAPLAVSIARIAQDRQGSAQARPTPLYLRAADAAPAKDLPPLLIE